MPKESNLKKTNVYCVCCERPLAPRAARTHHEGGEKKEVPVCSRCHWALHYGSLEVRRCMKEKIHVWLKKQQK